MDQPVEATTKSSFGQGEAALTDIASQLRFWLVTAVLLSLDLWSKSWVFSALKPNEERTVLSDWIVFRRSLNDGAVFGSFSGQVGLFVFASIVALGFVFYLFATSPRTSRFLHITLGLILAGAMGNLYDRSVVVADVVRTTTEEGSRTAMIGKIVDDSDTEVVRIGEWPEGANPRTYRRKDVTLSRQGVVRDFIKFVPGFPSWVPKVGGSDVWPWIFNVADAALVCGVIVLILASWTDHGRRQPKQASAP